MDQSSSISTQVTPESDIAPQEEPNEVPPESNEVWHDIHPTIPGPPNSDPEADQRSISIYWSLRSFSASTLSLFNLSSGRPSQDGATWEQALHVTNNSGFGPAGAPRSLGNKGVREGRERGGFLPRLRGVGRTGKEPYAVPRGMLKALGVLKEDEDPNIFADREELLESVLHRQDAVRRQFDEVEELAISQSEFSDEFFAVYGVITQLRMDTVILEDWDKTRLTEEQSETLKKLKERWTSIREKVELMEIEEKRAARLRAEEEERTWREWARVTGWRFADDARRFEPEHIENSIRNDYDGGISPRGRSRFNFL